MNAIAIGAICYAEKNITAPRSTDSGAAGGRGKGGVAISAAVEKMAGIEKPQDM